jgi:hypothetical protein
MVEKTNNYGLSKPSPEEFYDVDVQNNNMDIIDEKLALAMEKANKASPTGHKHTTSEITDFPTSMTPNAHTHKKSEITDLKTENWTFTLEDGSTVTKAVYVG